MNRLSAAAIASIAPQVLLIVLLIESNLALSFRVSGAQGCAKFLPPKLVKLLTKALKSGAKMGKTVLQITILSFSYSQFFMNCGKEKLADPIETGAIADDDYDPAGDAAQDFAADVMNVDDDALDDALDDAALLDDDPEKICARYDFGVPSTAACDEVAGGMDSALSYFTAILALFAAPYMAHVLLHTFVWGTGASDEEKHGFDWADGLDAQEEESLVNAGYYHRPDLVVLQQLKANLRSPLVRDIDGDAILLARNPRFYLDVLGTTKKNFREHFRHDELKDSARAVLRAMLHKMKLLLQITFGYWTKETLSVMEVKRFAVRFDVGGHEHKRAHQDIMEHFGCAAPSLPRVAPFRVTRFWRPRPCSQHVAHADVAVLPSRARSVQDWRGGERAARVRVRCRHAPAHVRCAGAAVRLDAERRQDLDHDPLRRHIAGMGDLAAHVRQLAVGSQGERARRPVARVCARPRV